MLFYPFTSQFATKRHSRKQTVQLAPKPYRIGATMKTASGLEYIEVEAGTGAQAEAGKTVSVHYTGKFQDGKVFDSSVSRGEPITFQLGKGKVIKGWDEGIALMKVGGKAQLIIPPQLGYGERGAGGVIPPNATLVFDVELVDVK
ncbi:MAG TPA: FKBP-type peptidyl-prolyl cis-trans isomerase [Anaerolineales bacterium]|nr:FKBP-type peptidyl-prolyl cis-trans isomerase [Anaerolineales bacterium]